MKKTQRILIGCVATCFCFIAAMLAGSFTELTAGIATSTNDAVQKGSDSSVVSTLKDETPMPTADAATPTNAVSPTPTNSPTPTLSPTPTISPTPTVSPTPTLSPTPTVTPTPTVSPTPVPVAYVPKFTLPAVTDNLNVRSGPGTNHKVIGKLSAGCYAIILEEDQNGWTKISTGSIKEGYISSEYMFSPEEVKSMCDREKLVSATVATSALNVRTGPGTHYEATKQVKNGQNFPVLLEKSYEGWLAIQLNSDTIGYISEDYVKFSYNMDTGLTLEEIEEIKKQKAIEEAMKRARIYSVPESTRTPVTMTDDELYLFATVIYTEAGNQKYEGMLAVANVILNRIENGHWGTTLEDVLFAPGQFEGAKKEYIDRAQKKGIPDECYKAAKEALGGKNNIGDFIFFRTTSSANRTADYITYTTFYILEDHVFYKKNW